MSVQVRSIIRAVTSIMVMGMTFGMVSPVMLQTRHDWNKLAEHIVRTRKDISPETVAGYLVDAEASIPSWYKGKQRTDAVTKQTGAREWLTDTARIAKGETISYTEALLNARRWATAHKETSVYASAALAYIHALPGAIDMYGVEGERDQLIYVLSNLTPWRGSEARASKEAIKKRVRDLGGTV